MHSMRYAIHPEDFKKRDAAKIREDFLIENLFTPDQINTTYSHYDRLIVGGAHPVSRPIQLETIDDLKADFFLQRRELGIINVGVAADVIVEGVVYTLQPK